ncbi:MAG: prepilin-type N-terminal cleavage/methylation domain-containing protein [Verrucomicrobiota bacterium]|jgi:prepilin-type N-terminal cleavage/methylation domain-containing protein
MKLTKASNMKRKPGMTLLELTVVILVLLSLISILFIGARAWKKGSDRAANILNIRNVQQAVRAHANVRGLLEGAALASTEIVGANKYLGSVTAPNVDITYAYDSVVPAVGTLYLQATYLNGTASDYEPTAGSTSQW